MRINHNIAALNTYRQLQGANNMQSNSMEKLSSGLRINRAADDAAGLAISEKMRGQIRGLDQAQRNAQDGISLIQTAEGALNETHSILQRMRELSVQSSNDTNTDADREEIQKEINQLTEEIDRIANTTEFNTQKLLDGSKGTGGTIDASAEIFSENSDTFSITSTIDNSTITSSGSYFLEVGSETTSAGTFNYTMTDEAGDVVSSGTVSSSSSFTVGGVTLTAGSSLQEGDTLGLNVQDDVGTTEGDLNFQIGANTGQIMKVDINDMSSSALNVDEIDVTTADGAEASVTAVEAALRQVSGERSKLGAFQNRLEHTINNLGTSSENLTAAESRVRDVDMAKEMMSQTKASILSQASQAMLAQANQMPQGVLQLLR
ncbi:flagellin N-terminal helical domain-containing protein [Gracilibacillus sp. D59]|uniref:flagellin N-terminal helical domain-containing protein n=1 Tax=Gracilibacillus sp. D59 TaxID=3457434 RepID=UPI003FCC5A5B